jgi:hypothetical protein
MVLPVPNILVGFSLNIRNPTQRLRIVNHFHANGIASFSQDWARQRPTLGNRPHTIRPKANGNTERPKQPNPKQQHPGKLQGIKAQFCWFGA